MHRLITTQTALDAACARFAKHDYVAVDTEFQRETTYWPVLCLVQLGNDEEAVAIDAFSKLNLKPLFELMKNPKVVKVFHAARQDIEIMWNLGKVLPQPLFDTQIAAQVLGLGEQISYADLVNHYLQLTLDKSSRFADWTKRPFTQKQIDYALDDVIHLSKFYPLMVEDLKKRGRLHWMDEELGVLLDQSTYDIDPSKTYEKFVHKLRKPRDLAIIMALSKWREEEAQRRNLARSRMMKDDALLDIALAAPMTIESMGEIRSVSRGFEKSQDGQTIFKLVREAVASDYALLPPLTRNRPASASQKATMELMRVLLKAISENEGVAPRIIASSEDLENLCHAHPKDCPPLHGWRKEIFGDKALALKAGKLALTFSKGKVEMINLPA